MLITLLDGKEYEFKALPFNKRSVALMERMEKEPIKALLEAVTYSLALTYGQEKAEELVESGALPFPKAGDKTVELISSAIFPVG